MLAYGVPARTQDDYMCMSDSAAMECMHQFFGVVVALFGELYLQSPTAKYTARIMARNAARGFLGMLGRINCMRWH
jgi:hypothetical protein